jgi:hypothetical protein
MITDVIAQIIAAIENDIEGRSGIGDEWERIPSSIIQSIHDDWRNLIADILEPEDEYAECGVVDAIQTMPLNDYWQRPW